MWVGWVCTPFDLGCPVTQSATCNQANDQIQFPTDSSQFSPTQPRSHTLAIMRSLFVAAAGAALLATPTAAAPSLAGRSIYFAMLDRFARAPSNSNTNETVCDGDRWCGGTISGLTSRIDYIASMGLVWRRNSPERGRPRV